MTLSLVKGDLRLQNTQLTGFEPLLSSLQFTFLISLGLSEGPVITFSSVTEKG